MKTFVPLFREHGDAADECITVRGNQLLLTDIKDYKCNLIADNRKRRRLFTLDHIFVKRPSSDENELQLEIFNCLGQEAMKSVWEGYNSSLFAYGMTGTGKTYTIFGTKVSFTGQSIHSCCVDKLRYKIPVLNRPLNSFHVLTNSLSRNKDFQ
ncbi:hypothetical protein PHET_01686 [Paragonimus heterotremus]|uniref:Kinesin motor domain-containing protein n=1 Tax=Paragonimus heterotremus TaxID=100268 RepID=A0A8J4X2Z5_9TREM|nr:hypothetical protein PHET_01686 [Paragonimus heterotremus]